VSRDGEALETISQTILSLSVSDPKIHNLGHLYQAFCLQTRGDLEASRVVLLHIADELPHEYQPRSILQLGVSYLFASDLRQSVALYVEAARAAKSTGDYLTRCQALRNLAVIRSLDGDHKGALDDLERQAPLVHCVGRFYPAEYYNHLNSIAVELGELGRIEEANRALAPALNSPFGCYYPDWKETKLELAAKQPKVFAPLVFALGALHQAREAIQPTRENLQAAQLAAPEVKTSENPAADVQAQPAQARKAIRRIPIIFQETFNGRICDPSFAGALRLLKSPSALSPNRPGYSISPPSRAPPPTTCLTL
jgi:tetratricopeptide (TPR) repeat protein